MRLPTASGRGRSGRREPPQPPLRVTGPGLEHVSRGRRVLALIALVAAGVAVWFLVSLFQPFKGSGSGSVVVTVPRAPVGQIGRACLEKRDVVSSQFFFSFARGWPASAATCARAGFVLKHGMSYGAALDALTKAPTAPRLAKVTIPRGDARGARSSARQVGPPARRLSGRDEGVASAQAAQLRRPYARDAGGIPLPGHYHIKFGAPASDLVAQQLRAFRRNFATIDLSYAKRKHLTRYDIITIASMIEREAAIPRERPLIAAVIYNRLHDRMPLGIDATIRYGSTTGRGR